MVIFLSLIAVILYIVASYMLWCNARFNRGRPTKVALLFWLSAMFVHGGMLYLAVITPQGIDLSLFNAISLSALLISLILFVISRRQSLAAIGIIILPLTALFVALTSLETSDSLISNTIMPGIQLHIVSSLLAYSLLLTAGIQALAIHRQISYLKIEDKSKHQLISTLPTLDAMESFLFALINLGVLLLTISLISGWIYHHDLFAQHLVHKTVLSVSAWVIFGIILIGKQLYGWRTNTAVKLVLIATILLILAYLGSKFVLEVVLDRI